MVKLLSQFCTSGPGPLPGCTLVDRPQVRLEVAGQVGRVGEPVVLGVLLDEEVERVDHGQIGDQTRP